MRFIWLSAVVACSTAPLPSPASAPRDGHSWNERLLCAGADRFDVQVVDETGAPIAGAEVWTEGLIRQGSAGFGETLGEDIAARGSIARTGGSGVAHVCDVSGTLLREYTTVGYQTGWSYLGTSAWLSVIGVDVFVQRASDYVRAPRYESFVFGVGTLRPLPRTIVFASAQPVEANGRPKMVRPSDHEPHP